MGTLKIYVLCIIMTACILSYNLDRNLELETDEDVINLFNKSVIKYGLISILSMFWIITLPVLLITSKRS